MKVDDFSKVAWLGPYSFSGPAQKGTWLPTAQLAATVWKDNAPAWVGVIPAFGLEKPLSDQEASEGVAAVFRAAYRLRLIECAWASMVNEASRTPNYVAKLAAAATSAWEFSENIGPLLDPPAWTELLANALKLLETSLTEGKQAAATISTYPNGEAVSAMMYLPRAFDPSVPTVASQGFVAALVQLIAGDLHLPSDASSSCPSSPWILDKDFGLLPDPSYFPTTSSKTANESLGVVQSLFHRVVLEPIVKAALGGAAPKIPQANFYAWPVGANVAAAPAILSKVIGATEMGGWLHAAFTYTVGPNFLALSAYALVAARELASTPKLSAIAPKMASLPALITASASAASIGPIKGAALAAELADVVAAAGAGQTDPIVGALAMTRALAREARVTADWACRLYAALLLAGRVDPATSAASVEWLQNWSFLTIPTEYEKKKALSANIDISFPINWVDTIKDPYSWAATYLTRLPVGIVNP